MTCTGIASKSNRRVGVPAWVTSLVATSKRSSWASGLSLKPRLLIVDEPTRGIDVGSKAEIHNLIRELARQGYAVIVISSEMPEVLRVADRIVAMYHGRNVREFTADEVTEDNLIQAISGLTESGTVDAA